MDELVGFPPGCQSPTLPDLLGNVVRSVSISDTKFGPFAALAAPLHAADPRDSLLRDAVTFHAPASPVSAIVFRREPAWAREGTTVAKDERFTQVSVTTAAQIAVSALGRPDRAEEAEEQAAVAAKSLAPLT